MVEQEHETDNGTSSAVVEQSTSNDGETNTAFEQDRELPFGPVPTYIGTRVALPGYTPSSRDTLPAQHNNVLARHRKQCAECCLHCFVLSTSLRFLLVALALFGAGAVIAGIILGALNMMAGNDFLTLSLLFIGLGVVMVIIVGLAWRCAPVGHEPCHKLCNIGQLPADLAESNTDQRSLRFYQRRNQWHGGMLYHEFEYGAPPPPYTATVRDIPTVIVEAENGDSSNVENGNTDGTATPDDNVSMPNSTPPSYRSRASLASIRPSIFQMRGLSASSGSLSILPPPDYPQSLADFPSNPTGNLAECGNATGISVPVTFEVSMATEERSADLVGELPRRSASAENVRTTDRLSSTTDNQIILRVDDFTRQSTAHLSLPRTHSKHHSENVYRSSESSCPARGLPAVSTTSLPHDDVVIDSTVPTEVEAAVVSSSHCNDGCDILDKFKLGMPVIYERSLTPSVSAEQDQGDAIVPSRTLSDNAELLKYSHC